MMKTGFLVVATSMLLITTAGSVEAATWVSRPARDGFTPVTVGNAGINIVDCFLASSMFAGGDVGITTSGTCGTNYAALDYAFPWTFPIPVEVLSSGARTSYVWVHQTTSSGPHPNIDTGSWYSDGTPYSGNHYATVANGWTQVSASVPADGKMTVTVWLTTYTTVHEYEYQTNL